MPTLPAFDAPPGGISQPDVTRPKDHRARCDLAGIFRCDLGMAGPSLTFGGPTMTAAPEATAPGAIRSLIPARIDRLPWSPFHTRMVIALGVAWILDGLEITVAGAVVALLTKHETLGLSSTEAGLIATVYLIGEVVGALVFGSLSDKLGRRKLFIVTLAVYLIGSGLTAVTLNGGAGWLVFLYATRFISGMGIGGEYAAINSAIDELIPARFRGRVDIMVNGTYWAGAIIGTLGTYIFLNQLDPSWGWRVAFLLGPVLGLVIIFVRRHLPESPRWQVMHGRADEAEESISFMEHEVQEKTGRELPPVDKSKAIDVKAGEDHGYLTLLRVLFREYPTRSVLGATMMITQSFSTTRSSSPPRWCWASSTGSHPRTPRCT
jgi:MFS family permease